jgi:hypothetical protein
MSARVHRVHEHITGDGLGIAAELQGKILVANAARAIDRQDQGASTAFTATFRG